jgi:predicted NAD/FAD-dependent oxidoreductase
MRLAIIGAGVAGLAAARSLRQHRPDLLVTIYEQGASLGGRVASRGRDAGQGLTQRFVFDHGAQYIKTPSPELERLLTAELPSSDLLDIGRPVWTFDTAGAIAEGDPAQNADPKWTYGEGLSRLGELLGAGLDIKRDVRVAAIRRLATGGQWSLVGSAGRSITAADLVLLTPPAPQSAAILSASEFDQVLKEMLLQELAHATYRRCISVALAYPHRIARAFYALVNSDRGHPISWLAFEHDKGLARCPPDHSLLIAQMAPGWSLQHWDAPAAEIQDLVAEHVGALLGEDLGSTLWADIQRWPHALPDASADFAALNSSGCGLYFAGDYTAGQGRVHLAIESGWRAAVEIERALD